MGSGDQRREMDTMTYRFVARDRLLFWCLIVGLLATSEARAQRGFELPDTVTRRAVDIWSEGTRLAGDLYAPRELAADETRPTIVMSHGWGGTKALLTNVASRLAAGVAHAPPLVQRALNDGALILLPEADPALELSLDDFDVDGVEGVGPGAGVDFSQQRPSLQLWEADPLPPSLEKVDF